MSINLKINEIGKLLNDHKEYDSSKLYELLDDIGILSDAKDKALSETSNKAALNMGVVMCRSSFKGEITKEHFYILLKYLDDMKLRGWVFEKHDRKNGKNNTLEIDYVLIKYGT